MLRTGIIAKKLGMTRLFLEDGRQVPVTVLLKALELPQMKGTENDREAQKRALNELFGDVDNNPEHRYMEATLEKDTTTKTAPARPMKSTPR